MRWQLLLSRIRIPLLVLALLAVFASGRVGDFRVPLPAALGLLIVVVLALRAGTVRREPITVQAPIRGRWLAINSPATRVPSHGIQVYGQAYAIDVVHEPEGEERPKFGWWPLARRPTDFPGFGQPVFGAAGGVVVRVHGRERDHWSRNSWLAMPYFLVEGIREVTGPSRVLGNHIVVDHGDGTYAAYAHLQRRSLRVTEGQRVEVGDHIADCGNSGNSTEPHLHFQLMDHRSVLVAAGLPVRFDWFETRDGEAQTGMPANNQTFHVPEPTKEPAP